MKFNRIFKIMGILLVLMVLVSGCTQVKSNIKDIKAETLGIARNFYVYDDFGELTLSVSGNRTDMQPSEVDNVVLITIDGRTWQHVGSTMIAAEEGLENLYDLSSPEAIDTTNQSAGTLTGIDRALNNFKSNLVGLKRIIYIKNQMGVLVAVYEGDQVLVEDSSLPDATKILIDDKRLTLYRCDFEIFESDMITGE